MNIQLKRFMRGTNDTLGLLFIDGKFACFTLEDEYREVKVPGETRIPSGTYELALTYSSKFTPKYGHNLVEILRVPNFSGIRIHRGNTEADTAGCILVGNSCYYNPDADSVIMESTAAYHRVYPMIVNCIQRQPTYIQIEDEQ